MTATASNPPFELQTSATTLILESPQLESLILPLRLRSATERLLGGESISDCYLHLHRQDSSISLSEVFFLAQRLRKCHYIQSSNMGEQKRPPAQIATPWTRPLQVHFTANWLSALLSALVLVGSVGLLPLCYGRKEFSPFLNLAQSHFQLSLVFVIGAIVACHFLASFFEIVLHTLTTGFFPRLKFSLSSRGPVIEVQDGYFLLQPLRSRIPMEIAIQVFALFCAEIWYLLGNSALSRAFFFTSMLMTLIFLNPYSGIVFQRISQWLFGEDELRHFLPYLRTKSLSFSNEDVQSAQLSRRLAIFSAYALGWSFAFLFVLHDLLKANLGLWYWQIGTGDWLTKINLLTIATGLCIGLVIHAKEILASVIGNIVDPLWLKSQTQKRARRSGITNLQMTELLPLLKSIPLFLNRKEKDLQKLSSLLTVESHQAGSPIVIQGEQGQEMFLLCQGQAEVLKKTASGYQDKLAELQPGAIFGELALFDHCRRTATIRAISACSVVRITNAMLSEVFSADELLFLKDHIRISSTLVSNSVFRQVPQELVSLFLNQAELRQVNAGETLIKEGEIGHDFFVILKGSFLVTRNRQQLAVLSPGEFFGEIALLQEVPRQATVAAQVKGELLVLNRKSFWLIVENNIGLAIQIETAALTRKAISHV